MQVRMIFNRVNFSSSMALVALLLGEGSGSEVLLVVEFPMPLSDDSICQCTESANGLVQVVP